MNNTPIQLLVSTTGCYAPGLAWIGCRYEAHIRSGIRVDRRRYEVTRAFVKINRDNPRAQLLHDIATALDTTVGQSIGVVRTRTFWLSLVEEVAGILLVSRPVDAATYAVDRIDGISRKVHHAR